MKFIFYNIPSLAFLGSALYLFTNTEHNVAAGWLIFAAIVAAVFPTSKEDE